MLGLCLAALITGQSADIATTLTLPAPHYREANRFVPSHPVGFVTLKASLTTATAVAGWKMRKQRPKLAAVIFIAGAATGTYAAIHNARLLRRR